MIVIYLSALATAVVICGVISIILGEPFAQQVFLQPLLDDPKIDKYVKEYLKQEADGPMIRLTRDVRLALKQNFVYEYSMGWGIDDGDRIGKAED